MAIPYLGIAGGLAAGAALGWLVNRFRGGGEQAQAPVQQQPQVGYQTVQQPTFSQPQRPTAIQRPTAQMSTSYSPRASYVGSREQIIARAGTVGYVAPTTVSGGSVGQLAVSATTAEEADNLAANIQSLPVFTPTAPEPVTTTQDYSSTKRLEIQKSKQGEKTLRNDLDRDAKASAIKSNLPSIGVSASNGVNYTNSRANTIRTRPVGIINDKQTPVLKRGRR